MERLAGAVHPLATPLERLAGAARPLVERLAGARPLGTPLERAPGVARFATTTLERVPGAGPSQAWHFRRRLALQTWKVGGLGPGEQLAATDLLR